MLPVCLSVVNCCDPLPRMFQNKQLKINRKILISELGVPIFILFVHASLNFSLRIYFQL
jgi:hypothetical protein